MKMGVTREFAQVNGNVQSTTFGIKASAKAFKILSSGLYSDKIAAIIRELSTNAFDSHMMNGNGDDPFEVTLPNSMNPNFIVRDYGVGLTKEELGLIPGIPGIYTTYFDSNKTNSNDLTGCLGLGSKSPFSYTKSFLVESFKDGIQYICSVHLNEYGEPTISLLCEQATTERNGLKVTVAIESNDIYNFQNKANFIYKWFTIKPIVNGKQFVSPEEKIVVEGTGWRLIRDNRHTFAIMGNVSYPITCDNTDFTEQECQILNLSFEIHFKLGELEFDAGRESLGYDKKTITMLKVKCKHILEEIKDKFSDVYSDCKNLWEARKKNVFVKNTLSQLSGIITLPNEFNGVQLFTRPHDSHIMISVKSLEITKVVKNHWSSKVKTSVATALNLTEDYKFFENDLKTGAVSRSSKYYEDVVTKDTIVLLRFGSATAKQEFCDFTGLPMEDIGLISTLPKAASKPRSSSGHSLEKISKYRGGYHANIRCWENITHDIKDGGVYVEIKRGKFIGKDDLPMQSNELYIVLQAIEILDKKIDLFGVKSVIEPKVAKIGNWEHLRVYIKNILDKSNLEQALKEYKDYNALNNYNNGYMIQYISKLDTNDDILNQIKTTVNNIKDVNKILAYATLYEFVHGQVFSGNSKNSLDKLVKSAIIKYPLLALYDGEKEYKKHFETYIEDILTKEKNDAKL